MPIILFLRYIIQNTSQPIQELDHGRKYLYVEILSRSYNEHTAWTLGFKPVPVTPGLCKDKHF